jgi:nitrogen regulatory protein PII
LPLNEGVWIRETCNGHHQTIENRSASRSSVCRWNPRHDGDRGQGYGRQQGHAEFYRGSEYAFGFLPKLKVEIVVPSEAINTVVETIAAAARTGQIGDGKIFVYSIDGHADLHRPEWLGSALSQGSHSQCLRQAAISAAAWPELPMSVSAVLLPLKPRPLSAKTPLHYTFNT